MVPMTPATSSRRAIAGYQAARIALDAAAAITIMAAAASLALVVFHDTRQDFIGGLNGRVVFTALVAAATGYAADGLFDTFFGGFRDRLVEARLDLLIEAAKDARHQHAQALTRVSADRPEDANYLRILKAVADKAEARAIRAGAEPAELS